MDTPKTRQAAVALKLREAIVDGVYAPGQRLGQQELARQYGCSVIPIREALHQLAAEGFVVLHPQRGARAAAFDGRMLEEIFTVRILLERYAIQRAAARMSPETAKRARSILERMERPRLPAAEWVRLDWEFHDTLCACGDQEYLRKLIGTVRRQMEPYLRLDLAKVGTIDFGRREHRKILEACVRHDGRTAARHLVAHLRRTIHGFVQYVRRHTR